MTWESCEPRSRVRDESHLNAGASEPSVGSTGALLLAGQPRVAGRGRGGSDWVPPCPRLASCPQLSISLLLKAGTAFSAPNPGSSRRAARARPDTHNRVPRSGRDAGEHHSPRLMSFTPDAASFTPRESMHWHDSNTAWGPIHSPAGGEVSSWHHTNAVRQEPGKLHRFRNAAMQLVAYRTVRRLSPILRLLLGPVS